MSLCVSGCCLGDPAAHGPARGPWMEVGPTPRRQVQTSGTTMNSSDLRPRRNAQEELDADGELWRWQPCIWRRKLARLAWRQAGARHHPPPAKRRETFTLGRCPQHQAHLSHGVQARAANGDLQPTALGQAQPAETWEEAEPPEVSAAWMVEGAAEASGGLSV